MTSKTFVEVREFQVPDEIQEKLSQLSEAAQQGGAPVTLTQGGVFEWLNGLARSEGWRPVWQTFQYPFIVMEREVTEDVEES